MKGKFITFEGCDGVGKSTQINFLREYLVDAGINAFFTREPGGTPLAEKIRELILDKDNFGMSDVCELLLYSASRAEHVISVIRPMLEKGMLVVCDRFTDSTLAYQGHARGLGFDAVNQLNTLSTGGLTPDLTLFLNAAPQESKRRQSNRLECDRLECESESFQQAVYEGFLLASKANPERIIVIPADGDKFATRDKILNALRERKIIP